MPVREFYKRKKLWKKDVTTVTTGLDYSGGKIGRLFSKMFPPPTLLGLIFNALITVVDGIFVGQGVAPDGIAAVNIIAPLFMVVTATGLMFGATDCLTSHREQPAPSVGCSR